VAERFGSPLAVTPKHLAERILDSKAALEGERKHVTVLFADLKGSMELLAHRDPEEARRILDPVLERMMEAVHRFEGTVNQVMGDGIMALFGAPIAHEDHAVRACYAALHMQESIGRYAEGVFRSYGIPLQIRVGVNSGDVVVRAIGSDLRMEYTAVGQTTHLAARMEQMATPGATLLAPATLQLAEGYVDVEARGPVAVKGLPEPVEIYALTGASAQRSRLHVAAARGLTRFVGRDTEIEHLRRSLAQAESGHGQLVAVVGEPGVGKSRLVYELTRSHRTQDWLVLEAGSVSYGKASSWLPVIDLLKIYFKVPDRETHREIREKVTGKILTLDRALEPILPALLTLLDVPIEDARWEALDPAQRRIRTIDAVKRLLLRESQDRPTLLVFEDLHWIDADTQALLDGLVESLPTARMLVLVNYRPEYEHGWASKTYYSQLRLDALPPESAGELLRALCGDGWALAPLERLLVRRGNPFFIEECVRTLVETGALAGERGAYRLTRPIDSLEVPATVQVILAARIDRLPAEEKQLLQTASVIGKDVPLVLLNAVAEAPEDAVQRGLSLLQAAEFLYETRLFPDPEYTFKHALTHDVVYGTLLQERRRTLHGQIVGAIEASYPDRLGEHVERLAHHALRGERWEQAVRYLRPAGAKALARSANWEAVAYFEQALQALEHLAESRETLEQAIDLRFDLRSALFPSGDFERIQGCLREAEGLARRIEDRRRLGWLSAYMSSNLRMTGHLREALAHGRNAKAIAESLGDIPLQVTGTLYFGAACMDAGYDAEAKEALLEIVRLTDGDRSRERFGLAAFPAVLARCFLTELSVNQGDFEKAIDHGENGFRLAEALDDPYGLAYACCTLGRAQYDRGEFGAAVDLLERGLAVSREWRLAFFSALCMRDLGYAQACLGRSVEGIRLLEQALSFIETIGYQIVMPYSLALLGEVYLLAGRLDDASAVAQRALVAGRRAQRHPRLIRFLGDLSASGELTEQAERHYHDALARSEGLGFRPNVAHCHRGLAELYRHTGRPEEAREHSATATTMYREMGMRFWLGSASEGVGDLE
jgi:class 3 adenylate cyclase/tetratricopeptide (TPR) repeat protein